MYNLEIREKICRAFKVGNFNTKIVTTALNILGFSNHYIGMVESREKSYRYVKRRYGNLIDSFDPFAAMIGNGDSVQVNNIWICWWQGEENAPLLVKRCIDSIRKRCGKSWNVTIITRENYLDYVTFPQYVEMKWNSGIISDTHMSDLLRLELLVKYGGIWLDATAFLTGKIPDFIVEKNLFLLKVMSKENFRVEYNNWFIFSRQHDPLLRTTQYLLYKYWEKENKVREYFLWHLMLTLVIEKHPEYVEDIYFIPDEIEHVLSNNWFKQYDHKYWNIVTSLTFVHKLTTKDKEPNEIAGTYYEKILKGEL